jgi:aspartyl-tRNA(Asn)/glutamyl-tRNA(Gln) amidotransferase subunit A
VPANPEVAAALDGAAALFAREGAVVRDVTLPPLGEFAAVNRTILNGEAWAIHSDWLRTRPGDYGRLARRRLMAGAFLSAGDYVQAQRRRAELIAAVQEALRDVDVLLAASSMDPPCRIDDADMVERTYPRQARTPFNVTGHPALAMMSGLSADGLPLSLQIIGRYFEEATVYQVAAAFERATPWHTMRAGEL